MVIELLPISTVLAVLTKQVLETAIAAHDVLIERESFRVLSKYLSDIQPVLAELRMRNMKDSPAARQALDSLSDDVKRAKSLVDNCTAKSRFWLLLNCRNIVKNAQQVTRDIGKSLALLSLASAEVSADIRDNVNRLQDEMQNTEFQASESQLRIIDKLESGLREHTTDQGFANDLVIEIAKAVGVPIGPLEISKELASFRREKEEAAERKEREEAAFMEQVIALLSQADAASTSEVVENIYYERLMSISSSVSGEEQIAPLQSFICPLKHAVMVDPVSLCTGTTCEREEIQLRFDQGYKTDPVTQEELSDFTMRPNVPLKQSIKEWVERNYCLKIKAAKSKLESGDEARQKNTLCQLQELCEENPINKDWIAIEGLIPAIVMLLAKAHSRDIKMWALSTLEALVTGHVQNKDKVVEAGGVKQVVRCLARDAHVSKAAVKLLSELLQDGHQWNLCVHREISKEKSAFLLLVTLLNGADTESAQKAETILQNLCNNDENIVQMAAANWYGPLIDRLNKGPEESKLIMAKALAKMELTDQSKKLLGEEAIPPLVKMIQGNLESKAEALGALHNLSSCCQNKKYMAYAGAIPLVLDHLFSSRFPTSVRELAALILEKVMWDDGIQFLVDVDGTRLDLEPVIHKLLAVQQNPSISLIMRRHVLNALVGMVSAPDAEDVKRIAREANGVSILLPLLDNSDKIICESAIKLICCLSEGGSSEVSNFLLEGRKFDILVSLLEDDSMGDIHEAVAGILANLPTSDGRVTAGLLEAEALPPIVRVLKNGTSRAKENALGALIRFTDPSDVNIQHMVVELGAYPILVSMLHSGAVLAKTRAAVAIGNLSSSTPHLSMVPQVSGCWCFKSAPPLVCRVHRGLCDVSSTFCLLEADAIPGLVNLVRERDNQAAGAGIHALGTLVNDEDVLENGAEVLHEAMAIEPVLDILSLGTDDSKEEAVKFLEKIFRVNEMVELYESKARIPLVDLATHGDTSIKRKACKVLAQLEVKQGTSTYL